MKIKFLILAIAIAGFFSSCKKNSLDEQAMVTNTDAAAKARSWFEKQPAGSSTTLSRTGNSSLSFNGSTPVWDRTIAYSDANTIVTPVNIGSSNKTNNGKVTQLLVNKTAANGEIESGSYAFVLSKEASNVDPRLLVTGKIPADFNGAIISYSIDGQLLSAQHYSNGKVSSTDDKLTIRSNENLKEPGGDVNLAPPPSCGDGGSQVCIDWYWQTWQNGVLIYEEYLYTSCNCAGSGGGGGGNGGNIDPNQALMDFVNEGRTYDKVMTDDGGIVTPAWMNKTYSWVIFTAGTWGINSYESAALEKKHYTNIDLWEFTSFTHTSASEFGMSIGGTRSFAIVSTTPNISPSKTLVEMKIDFSVTSKVGALFPLTLLYNSTGRATAPNNIVAS